jgi:molybdopterin/thiamine biosynthesis adenylyltransferase
LPEVGGAGQERLLDSSVLVVGAGGLGSPVGLYLAAAGVGRIGVADGDVVDLTNLQRQIAHGTPDVDRPKVESFRESLARVNPGVRIEVHDHDLDPENVRDIVAGYDVVLDGTDNFPTRYLLNDACRLAGRPLVSGAVLRFEGQLTVFEPGGGRPCYRCLFPEPPDPETAPKCSDAGVLGAVAGVIGTLMAVEAVKLLLGEGQPLTGRLLLYDALTATTRVVGYERDPACVLCGDRPEIERPAWIPGGPPCRSSG